MSGHSKWATIKHQKAANDAARGKLFSKLVKAIQIAVKTGGGTSPDTNPKLRVAIDAARAANMPKDNIDRAISRASGEAANVEELTYEGFGPEGVGVLVQVATDNRNRTGQEIKNLFERSGGSLAGPGSVSHNFEPKGYILIEKKPDSDAQMLELIDLGVEDVEASQEGIEVYTGPTTLFDLREKLEASGHKVLQTELIQKPKTHLDLKGESSDKVLKLLDSLDDHDDVQKLFTNADFA